MPEPKEVIADLLANVRKEEARLNREIEELERTLQAKRDELKTYTRIERATEPPRKYDTHPKPLKGVAPKTVEVVLAFLLANADRYSNSGGFTATSLWRDAQEAGGDVKVSSQTINVVCHELREQGRIRLVRRGTGGSRIYRLVSKT